LLDERVEGDGQTGGVIGDPIGEPLEQLLDRLRGPGSRRVFELVERSQLHRPLMIDSDEAMTAVRPYTWLLERVVDDGIKLTGAGRLPPAVVSEAMSVLEDRVDWIGKANREEHTLPVFELREAGRPCRLVRKNKGTLVLTPTGRALRRDPVALWWHLAAALPDASADIERDAGTMLLLAVGAGLPLTWDIARKVVTDGLAAAGWQISGTGEPLNEWQAFEAARDTWTILEQLAALVRPRYGDPPAVPTPAAVTFARAALRGSEWSSSTAAARG
jgi:hypothetical protein